MHTFHGAAASPHLNDSVAELQRVEELDQGRHLEPVLPVEAVPVLARDVQLGGQGGVQAAKPCGQHLGTEQLHKQNAKMKSSILSTRAGCCSRLHLRPCWQISPSYASVLHFIPAMLSAFISMMD